MRYEDREMDGIASVVEGMGKRFVIVYTPIKQVLLYSQNEFIDSFRNVDGKRILEHRLKVGTTFEVKKVKKTQYEVERVGSGYRLDSGQMVQYVSDELFYKFFRVPFEEETKVDREEVENWDVTGKVIVHVYFRSGNKETVDILSVRLEEMRFKAFIGDKLVEDMELRGKYPTVKSLLGRVTKRLDGAGVKVLAYDVMEKATGQWYLMNRDGTCKKL